MKKATSSSYKKRHFDYQTVDKDGVGFDENLQDEYLKERRVDVGSDLAKTLFYTFNPKRNAD